MGYEYIFSKLIFIFGNIFSVEKIVPIFKTVLKLNVECSILIHVLLSSVIIFFNQVVLKAAIKRLY